MAGLTYGIVGRPFDVARSSIWTKRADWAKDWKAYHSYKASSSSPRSLKPPNKLPSAISCIREVVWKEGVSIFAKGRLSERKGSQTALLSHPALGGGLDNQTTGFQTTARRITSRSGKILRFCPPFSVGFLIFAIYSGDLRNDGSATMLENDFDVN